MSDAPHNVWVFVCYRRTDGSAPAEAVYRLLHDRQYRDAAGRLCQLSVYFDRAAPGVADWQGHHFPSLQSARALILISTPGIAVDFSERDKPDWLYKELRWWMQNRKTSPIVIDATGEGDRWLPKFVRTKWPNLNRLDFPDDLDVRSESSEPAERLRQRIIRTIIESESATVFEDVERLKRLARRLKSALAVGGVLLIASLTLAALAVSFANQSKASEAAALDQTRVAERMRAATLDTLQWTVNAAARMDFGRSDLPVSTQEILAGTAIRLTEAGYEGRIQISADPGKYCHSRSMVALLAPEQPVSLCHFHTDGYSLSLSERLAFSVKYYLERKGVAADRIDIVAAGAALPDYEYPCSDHRAPDCTATARQWNEIAALNNGIRLKVIDEVPNDRKAIESE